MVEMEQVANSKNTKRIQYWTVRISPKLRRRIAIEAAESDVSIRKWVEDAILNKFELLDRVESAINK